MIRAGITKHRERVDVVIGVVETHGRKEIDTLLKELEMVPSDAFNCRRVSEMDLDAVLARRPELVLVDELASRQRARRAASKALHGSPGTAPVRASTSTRTPTCSRSKASTTSSPRSPVSVRAKPFPTAWSTRQTTSRSSMSLLGHYPAPARRQAVDLVRSILTVSGSRRWHAL